MNIIKKYFTLKRILIFFVSVFFILFFVGGCSFKYMDWQYYKFKKMIREESGIYIYNQALYDEIEYLRKKNGGVYDFNIILQDGTKLYEGILSNGYEIISNPSPYEKDIVKTKYSRISQFDFIRYKYFDSDGARHIVAKVKGFYYIVYGLWISGDEGGGFHWVTKRTIGGYLDENIFYKKGEHSD